MQVNDAEKQKSLDVAEESRETEWQHPGFVAELFKGNFAWELIHPFPLQDAEDRRTGDEFIEKVRPALEAHVDPSAVDRTADVPEAALKALMDLGVFGMKIPEEYGGLGFSHTNYSRLCAYISSYCASTGAWITAHQSIGVPQPLKLFGTKEQKEKFLPRLAKGGISAFALTEPNVGSDPARMETRAEPTEDGKHYIINGDKLWITNGTAADTMIVMARTPSIVVNGKERPQITAFVFETDTPGFEVVHRCDFMGIRGIRNGLLRFKDAKVPAENIIGKPGMGLKIALATLNTGRLSLPATATSGAKAALRSARKWCAERSQWGAVIGRHQSTGIKLAQMSSITFAMDAVTWLCCALADKGSSDIRIEAAMAKYYTTEMACHLADEFLQIRGGRGYETAESLAARGEEPVPAERFVRDARIMRILEGTSEIMQLFIAREAMDVHVRQIMPFMKKGVNKAKHLFRSFLPFYLRWYPKLWLPARTAFETKHLSRENQAYLPYISRASKRLAKIMFHAMVKHQEKLEHEQLVLADFVNIGTELFVMAALLSYADAKLPEAEDTEALQTLVKQYCLDARDRIEGYFKHARYNHGKMYDAVAEEAMAGKYDWFCDGIYTDIPPGYRRLMPEQKAGKES
jgi:alkylation response protein AidB-like acyl-CoA dehydrogenase